MCSFDSSDTKASSFVSESLLKGFFNVLQVNIDQKMKFKSKAEVNIMSLSIKVSIMS